MKHPFDFALVDSLEVKFHSLQENSSNTKKNSKKNSEDKFDTYVFLLKASEGEFVDQVIQDLPSPFKDSFAYMGKKKKWSATKGQILNASLDSFSSLFLAYTNSEQDQFSRLRAGRKVVEAIGQVSGRRILVETKSLPADLRWHFIEALLSAFWAQEYRFMKYKSINAGNSPAESPNAEKTILVNVLPEEVEDFAKRLPEVRAINEGTNLVRHLAKRAGSDLTCSRYVSEVKSWAQKKGFTTEFLNAASLEKEGAGAFYAVCKGSTDWQNAGILRVSYAPAHKEALKKVALVGKGIVFDTGGLNLKTSHMYGMNQDMAGSSVVLALLHVASALKWDLAIEGYLAIAENAIGPGAYRPNDVVRSLKGLTIEVVDTDAEGRMVLSDTLTLASKENPDLMIDFATLTGACIRSIGRNYSGVFTNQQMLISDLIRAGQRSGERIWPFPLDEDYGECLDSEVADIKQCRSSGGVDHIEAAFFLKSFVDAKIPWIHVDLAAAECEGGLAHVPTKETGFGVRAGVEMITHFFSSTKG